MYSSSLFGQKNGYHEKLFVKPTESITQSIVTYSNGDNKQINPKRFKVNLYLDLGFVQEKEKQLYIDWWNCSRSVGAAIPSGLYKNYFYPYMLKIILICPL